MAYLRGGVGCEAFLGSPARAHCARDAPTCSVTLEHPVSIHHHVTYTLGALSVPSSVSINLSFHGTTDSRGGIRSLEKLSSHPIEPADTINHRPCSLHRCHGGTDTCECSVVDIRQLQTRQGHLPGCLRRCCRYRNGAPLAAQNTKKVPRFRVVFVAYLWRYVDMFPSGAPSCRNQYEERIDESIFRVKANLILWYFGIALFARLSRRYFIRPLLLQSDVPAPVSATI